VFGVFRTLITSYTQLTLAAFLQVRVLDLNTSLFAISSYCGIIFVVLAGVIPIVTFLVIYKFNDKTKYMKRKFGTLIEELKLGPEHFIPKYFNFFFLIRRLVLCLSLVFLYYYPYLEISVLLLSCLMWLFLLWKYLPYESNLNNVVNIVTEAIFLGIHVLIFILVHDDFIGYFSDQDRLNFGWGIIGGCGMILVVSLVASFAQQYKVMKELLKLFWKVLKKEKTQKGKRRVRREMKEKGSPPPMVVVTSSMGKIYPEKFERLSIDSMIPLDNSVMTMINSQVDEPYHKRKNLNINL